MLYSFSGWLCANGLDRPPFMPGLRALFLNGLCAAPGSRTPPPAEDRGRATRIDSKGLRRAGEGSRMPGMAEDPTRGNHAAETGNPAEDSAEESGYVTTEVAAAGLEVSPRTVRDYIKAGKLQAKPEGEGVERRWLVSVDSLHALRQSRRDSTMPPRDRRHESLGGEVAAELAADLIATVQDLQYRLGRSEARAELTERAESTVREERDRLLEEAERLRRDLEAARRPWWRRVFGG